MKKVTVVYVLLLCSSKWKHEAKLLYTRLSVRLSMCLSFSCPALRMMRLSYRYFGTLHVIVVTPCWKANPPVSMARVDTESSLFSHGRRNALCTCTSGTNRKFVGDNGQTHVSE